jgi:hypothetical protein
LEVGVAALGAGLGDLSVDERVEGILFDGAEYAHRIGEIGLRQVAQQEADGGDGFLFIVYQQIGGLGVAEVYDARLEAVVQGDPFLVILAEDQRLSVFEVNNRFSLLIFVGCVAERAVVEDDAVLVDFDQRSAGVFDLVEQRPNFVEYLCTDLCRLTVVMAVLLVHAAFRLVLMWKKRESRSVPRALRPITDVFTGFPISQGLLVQKFSKGPETPNIKNGLFPF